MSRRTPNAALAHAQAFAALGDATRLSLVTKLAGGEPRSITQLTARSPLTRQAITKHLRILEDAGLLRSERAGRETHYIFAPARLRDLQDYLEQVSNQWDQALTRLRDFVEGD